MALRPELFEGFRFDFTRPLNGNFFLSHAITMGNIEMPTANRQARSPKPAMARGTAPNAFLAASRAIIVTAHLTLLGSLLGMAHCQRGRPVPDLLAVQQGSSSILSWRHRLAARSNARAACRLPASHGYTMGATNHSVIPLGTYATRVFTLAAVWPQVIKVPMGTYEFGANVINERFMLLGRITNDGRLSGRVMANVRDWMTAKLQCQLSNEQGGSQVRHGWGGGARNALALTPTCFFQVTSAALCANRCSSVRSRLTNFVLSSFNPPQVMGDVDLKGKDWQAQLKVGNPGFYGERHELAYLCFESIAIYSSSMAGAYPTAARLADARLQRKPSLSSSNCCMVVDPAAAHCCRRRQLLPVRDAPPVAGR